MSEVSTGGPGPCPECEGRGRQTIGPLSFVCDECGGTGTVGGAEHASREDGREYDPATDGPLAPAGRHPAVKALGVCPVCLNARKVLNLGGTGPATGRLIEVPCPECAA